MNEKIVETRTSIDQSKTQKKIEEIYNYYQFDIQNPDNYEFAIDFNIKKHFKYAFNMTYQLPSHYRYLDPGMPWFPYWILNIIELTNLEDLEISKDDKLKFVKMLKECINAQGGFSGYTKGSTHLASNYAGILAIALLGIKEGYDLIDETKMKNCLLSLKNNNFEVSDSITYDSQNNFIINKNDYSLNSYQGAWPGCFSMHTCGDSDLRATYCALVVADLLNILDEDIKRGVAENIKKCQTIEGGLGPEPLCEAHGGYSFCGIASLVILNKLETIDINRFLHWIVNRQMTVEGGFSGRTNKLVDSCYSWWQAAVFNLLVEDSGNKYTICDELLYDQIALQAYLGFCCQDEKGGMKDKPGVSADLYHTNYSLCGMSMSQFYGKDGIKTMLSENFELNSVSPIYSINRDKVQKMKEYFINKKKK